MPFYIQHNDDNSSLLMCDCGQSDIGLRLHWEESDFGEPLLEISGWRERRGFIQRVKEAWVVLRHGFAWPDLFLLQPEDTRALGNWLVQKTDRGINNDIQNSA